VKRGGAYTAATWCRGCTTTGEVLASDTPRKGTYLQARVHQPLAVALAFFRGGFWLMMLTGVDVIE